MKTYYDKDGNERSLEWLVQNSPGWAANRMRSDRTEINLLKADIERMYVRNNQHRENVNMLTRMIAKEMAEVEDWRKYAATIETERDEARANLTIRRTELEHTYSEIERLTKDLDVSKTSYEVLEERYWKSAAEKERMKSKIEERDGAIEMILLRELRLREALERMTTDCMESDFNEHWDTFKNAEAVLTGKDKT